MLATRLDPILLSPATWFLIFESRALRRWVGWLAFGRFKHVGAIGWVPEASAWLLFDVSLARTSVEILPDTAETHEFIRRKREGCVTLAVASSGRASLQMGGWCAPAMAALVGIKGPVFRPDALFKKCLARGARLVP